MKTELLKFTLQDVSNKHQLDVTDIISDLIDTLTMLNAIDRKISEDVNYIGSENFNQFSAAKNLAKLKLINKISTL